MMKPSPALIVDPNIEFLAQLSNDPNAKFLPPVTAKSGKEAQLLLADSSKIFGGVFVNYQVNNPHGISVIRFCHLHRPMTPVFMIYDAECPFTKDELRKLGIQKILPKPMKYGDFMSLIAPAVAVFDNDRALELGKKNQDALNSEVSEEDAQFVPIRAENFLAGSKSFFDIYVRLGSGRYLKLVQAGDTFTIDRVTGYIQKGVTHFYLRKEAQEHYVAYCDKLAAALIKSGKIADSIKVNQTLNQGEETFKFLRDQGLSEVHLQYAANFMKNVNELIQGLKPGKQPLLKGFLNDVAAYDHGVGTSVIAALLANSMQMTSSDPVETVGVAAMLHDIGLYQLDLVQFEEDESLMNEEQKTLYYTHPVVGAEILKTIPKLKPVVLQAVAQHHERRNKKGFPMRIGPGSISMVADIVGMSDEFNRIIKKVKQDPKIELIPLLEERIFNAFSNSLVGEFKKIFCFVDEEPKKDAAQADPAKKTEEVKK